MYTIQEGKNELFQSRPFYCQIWLQLMYAYDCILSLWNVFVHHGVKAVEEVSTGEGEGEKGEEQLRPPTICRVADVTRLTVEGDDCLHVPCYLLLPPAAILGTD